MTVDVHSQPIPRAPDVLQAAAADIRQGDQVAFAWSEGGVREEAAGAVTGVRYSLEAETVAVVVDNRVHFLHADHRVIIIRGLASQTPRR